MFGSKKVDAALAEAAAASQKELHDKAIAYINNEIDTMRNSANWSMVYGILCFTYDLGIINHEERQALDNKCRNKSNALLEIEKAQKLKEKEEKARIIAQYEAERKEKAKAARAKMAEGKQ